MKFINTLEDLFPKFGAKMTCKHFQTVGPGQHLATKPAHALHLNCPWCEIEQLRFTLSIAEEGLANYAQENAQLKAAIELIQQERLTWAMTCHPHECTACDLLDQAIRASQPQPALPLHASSVGGFYSTGSHLVGSEVREEIMPARVSLLREPCAHATPGCYCTERCAAPVIMGQQMPCRDPEKAARFAEKTQSAEHGLNTPKIVDTP